MRSQKERSHRALLRTEPFSRQFSTASPALDWGPRRGKPTVVSRPEMCADDALEAPHLRLRGAVLQGDGVNHRPSGALNRIRQVFAQPTRQSAASPRYGANISAVSLSVIDGVDRSAPRQREREAEADRPGV